MHNPVFSLVVAVLSVTACENKRDTPEPPPQTIAEKPTKKPAAAPTARLTVDGAEMKIGTILAWEMKVSESLVPQLYFYAAEDVPCEDRVTHQGTRLYSAALIPDGFEIGGPYKVPNWSYSDKAGMVPIDHAEVTITASTPETVEGVANYTSAQCALGSCNAETACAEGRTCGLQDDAGEGVCLGPCAFALTGTFVAKRCPIYED